MTATLTQACRERIDALFDVSERAQVASLLAAGCGGNLPGCASWSPSQLDRVRFGVLKLSLGDMEKLRAAIKLAQTDWRDLLVASDFADSVTAHLAWKP